MQAEHNLLMHSTLNAASLIEDTNPKICHRQYIDNTPCCQVAPALGIILTHIVVHVRTSVVI
jgi:hypothetical protein